MSKLDPRGRPNADRTSLYDEITGKILAELEAGLLPWVQPWGTTAANARLQARATPVRTTFADGQRPSRRAGNMLEP